MARCFLTGSVQRVAWRLRRGGSARSAGRGTRRVRVLAALLALLAPVGCSPTMQVPEIGRISRSTGYRAPNMGRTPGEEPALPGKYVVLAFSGGGTRAAALAHGVLRELEATPAPTAPGLTLLEGVDMISSASGGSVAAANYVVHGREGYRRLDRQDGFLRHDGMVELVGGVLLAAPFYAVAEASRIELLSAMMARKVVGEVRYRDLFAAKAARRPFLVLNAADMASGERFPFTQDQLDLLCLDLGEVRVADAIAASAAFPGALTPLPLNDRSPCPAQMEKGGREVAERTLLEAGMRFDLGQAECDRRRAEPLQTKELTFRSRGMRQYRLLNVDGCGAELPPGDPRRVGSVHLLDGGIADNLGLAGPLETLTVQGDDHRVTRAMRRGQVTEVVVVAVNARSQPDSTVGRDGRTPGVFSMVWATIGSAIDARSGGLVAQLGVLRDLVRGRTPGREVRVTTIPVDFELIHDAGCRAAFQGIATTWALSLAEVEALQEVASAMLRANDDYLRLAGVPEGPTREAARLAGQARAHRACLRLQGSEGAPAGPPVFGPPPSPAPQMVTSPPASSPG